MGYPVSTKTVNFYKFLKKESDAIFAGSHSVHTPESLVNEILSQIPDLSNKKILVLFNVEFVISLVYTYNVNIKDITFYSDHDDKTEFVKLIGDINIINNLGNLNMKFDVVVGNPPFQGDKGNGTRAEQLFAKFVYKAFSLTDNLYMVLPSLWTHKPNKLKETLINKGMTTVVACSKHFDRVGIPTCYVMVTANKKDTITIVTESGFKTEVSASPTIQMNLNSESNITESILSKIKSDNHLGKLWKRSSIYNNDISMGHGNTNIVTIIDTATETIEYSTTTTALSDFPYYNSWKVITNLNLGSPKIGVTKVLGPNIATSYSIIAFGVKDETQAESLKSFFDSKLISFVFKQTKNTVSKNRNIFERISTVNLDKPWADAELYNHFKLTKEEIEYIESNVK